MHWAHGRPRSSTSTSRRRRVFASHVMGAGGGCRDWNVPTGREAGCRQRGMRKGIPLPESLCCQPSSPLTRPRRVVTSEEAHHLLVRGVGPVLSDGLLLGRTVHGREERDDLRHDGVAAFPAGDHCGSPWLIVVAGRSVPGVDPRCHRKPVSLQFRLRSNHSIFNGRPHLGGIDPMA